MRGIVTIDSRLRWRFASALLLLAGLPCLAQQVSLGEFARQQRAARGSTHARVITNDDLGDPRLSLSTTAPAATTAPEKSASATKPAPPASSVDAFKEKETAFRARYNEQQREVERTQRRLSVAEHEYDYQTTIYWMDAGSRLRENNTWAEKRARYEKEIDDTRKQLSSAQEKLEAIKEEARRAGLSETSLEP